MVCENLLKHSLRRIATPQPNDGGRRPKTTNQVNEVLVLGEYHHVLLSPAIEYLFISRVSQSNLAKRPCFVPKAHLDPLGDSRGEMGIKPNHAAITG